MKNSNFETIEDFMSRTMPAREIGEILKGAKQYSIQIKNSVKRNQHAKQLKKDKSNVHSSNSVMALTP